MPEPDELLAQTIARHFEGSSVEGSVARIGLGGVEVDCQVNSVREMGAYQAASLFFQLSGGPLGPDPIFASISGYEKSAEAAIVGGACNWACAFGPVLRAGLTGVGDPEADEFEIVLDGCRYRGVVEGMDRVMMLDAGAPEGLIRETRDRLGADPWLTPQILTSSALPVLTTSGPTILSVFLSQGPQGQTLEVKVNGTDWGPACSQTEGPEVSRANAIVMLRELAVLTVIEPAPPQREAVQRTLDGLAHRVDPEQVAGWPGWQAHGGQLGDLLADVEVSVIEVDTGTLPADYRYFLTQVAGPGGAGPGYGLSHPRLIDRSVLLAHAGCGVAWVLRLDPAEYGTVWVDAVGSDGTFTKVADSFTEWFTDWLDASVRDQRPWVHWDVGQCATPGVLGQALTAKDQKNPRREGEPPSLAGSFGPGAILISSGEGYFPEGTALDPCHGCVHLAARLDLPPNVFVPGILLSPP